MTRRILKYATGDRIPKGAIYLCTLKNGKMDMVNDIEYIWHYFLVKVKEETRGED